MKRFTHRFLPLALCCTLTLGAFAYRPPQAEAVAGVDDATVIGALLTAFAGGCGLIFSNNGMTSRQIADGIAQKWYEFRDFVGDVDQTFAEWLGYENTSALVEDLAFKDGTLVLPKAVARKFADFTNWFVKDTGIVSPNVGDTPASVPASAPTASVSHPTLVDTGSNFAFSTYSSASPSVYCDGFFALESFSAGSAIELNREKYTFDSRLIFDVGNGCSIQVFSYNSDTWTYRLAVNGRIYAPWTWAYFNEASNSSLKVSLAYYNGLPTLVFVDESMGLVQAVDMEKVFSSAYVSYAAAFTVGNAGAAPADGKKPVCAGGSYIELNGSRMILSSYSSSSVSNRWIYFEDFSPGTSIPFPLGVYDEGHPLEIAVADDLYYRAYQTESGSLRFNTRIGNRVYSTGNGLAYLSVAGSTVYFSLALYDGLPIPVVEIQGDGERYFRGYYTQLFYADFWNALSALPFSPSTAGLSASILDDVQAPDLADTEDTPVGVTGVGWDASTIEELLQQILERVQANTLAPTIDIPKTDTGTDTGEDAKPYLPYIPQIFEKIKDIPGTLSSIWETIKSIPAAVAEKIGTFFTTLWGWLQNIIDAIKAVPAAIAEAVGALFKPDEALVAEITDTFKGKFGFLSTLNSFVTDLFGMSAETEPPVIWVHLEDAESKYGYVYGDKQKMLDLSWYQKYKASVDGLLSGFLWLGYLWLLFKRAPGILNGMSMEGGLLPPLQTGGDVSDAPRIGSGNPSMHYGDGFTFRDKGGRRR